MKEDLYGSFGHIEKSGYNLMEAVIIRLSKQDTEIGHSLIDLLHGVFGSMPFEEKMSRLDKFRLDDESIKESTSSLF